jgi:hypothetical protein
MVLVALEPDTAACDWIAGVGLNAYCQEKWVDEQGPPNHGGP